MQSFIAQWVELRGFGAFSVKNRPARVGRNPRTGETVHVAEKRLPFFKVGKELKELVNASRHTAISGGDDSDDFDLLESLQSVEGALGAESAADSVSREQILLLIEAQIAELPARQREAFLMRYWEEFDVAETAEVMGCSEGSVKTHCSRAVHALAKALRAKGISP